MYNTRVSQKILQYFHNMKHNFAALNAFAKVMTVTNYTRLILSECCSRGLFLCLDAQSRNSRFKTKVEVLIAPAKFPKSSGYCAVINCTFTFRTINVFGCFRGIMSHFKLIMHKWVKKCIKCQRTNKHDTTNNSGYLPQLELAHLQNFSHILITFSRNLFLVTRIYLL